MTYGYVRIYSRDRNGERPIIAIHEFAVEDKQICLDEQPGLSTGPLLYSIHRFSKLNSCIFKGPLQCPEKSRYCLGFFCFRLFPSHNRFNEYEV